MSTLMKDKQFISLVKMSVAESVQQVLADPDFGLELTDSFKKRLLKYRNEKTKKFVSFDDIKKKYLMS